MLTNITPAINQESSHLFEYLAVKFRASHRDNVVRAQNLKKALNKAVLLKLYGTSSILPHK